MAACDSLQPSVVLTDVMESRVDEVENVLVPGEREDTIASNSDWFQVEQTEPLNLCLNGTIMKGLRMVEYYSEFVDCANLSEASDDDVIFVKEFKAEKKKAADKANGKKSCVKGAPRRNPVRRARNTKRFKDFTDVSFEESDFLDDSDQNDEDDNGDEIEESPKKNEDSEEWNLQNSLKKTKQKRKRAPFKYTKSGRRKRIVKTAVTKEKKQNLKELENLLEENFVLVRDYVKSVKFLSDFQDDSSERMKPAKDLLKQQVILLAVTKDLVDVDALNLLED